jgi:hypothetical protein
MRPWWGKTLMPIVTCPGCQKTAYLPNELSVTAIKCSACGLQFSAPSTSIKSPQAERPPITNLPARPKAPSPPIDDLFDSGTSIASQRIQNAPSLNPNAGASRFPAAMPPANPIPLQPVYQPQQTPQTKSCPYCAEEIQLGGSPK